MTSAKVLKNLQIVAVLSIFSVSVYCATTGIDSSFDTSEQQIRQTSEVFRSICQPKFNISDERVLGARDGKFHEDKDFKCYVHCVLENMGVMKKNRFMHDQTTRTFNTLLPEDYKEPWKNAVTVCKDEVEVVKNQCDLAFNIVQCFHKHNPKFTFA